MGVRIGMERGGEGRGGEGKDRERGRDIGRVREREGRTEGGRGERGREGEVEVRTCLKNYT